jgi:hypothetical protein
MQTNRLEGGGWEKEKKKERKENPNAKSKRTICKLAKK